MRVPSKKVFLLSNNFFFIFSIIDKRYPTLESVFGKDSGGERERKGRKQRNKDGKRIEFDMCTQWGLRGKGEGKGKLGSSTI